MPRETEVARREERGVGRADPERSPFRLLDRFAGEMDRVFSDLGLGRSWMAPTGSRGWLSGPTATEGWGCAPDVEAFHRNNEFVIRADLPGLTKNDVKVDVTEDLVTIEGERKREHKEEREGYYRTERSYGSFCRQIALPTGTISDQAKATFKDGVLEITRPAPPASARRGRRLEIAEGVRK